MILHFKGVMFVCSQFVGLGDFIDLGVVYNLGWPLPAATMALSGGSPATN